MRLAYRTVVRKRTEFLFYAFAALYALVGLRLTYLQAWNAEHYEAFGNKIRNRKLDLPAQRGVIYDRVGRELAINVRAASIYAHPSSVKNVNRASYQLAGLIGCDQGSLAQKMNLDKKFVWLRRGVEDGIGSKVEEAELKGIGVIKEHRRVYPSGLPASSRPYAIAAHIVGFTNIDGKGLEGVEKVAERYLKGSDGFVIAEVDPDGRVIPETRRNTVKPHDGKDVVLTLDAYIQHVAEEELEKAFITYKARGATAVVLDPRTGEILALANMPSFNPNDRKGSKADQWRNRGITDLYEPGSTLKTITAAAALEEGVINHNTVFANCSGCMEIGRRKVRCVLHHPYERGHQGVDLERMISYSCNIGASELGLKLGAERLHQYAKAFGLLSVPGSGLAGETTGWLQKPASWPNIKSANVAFGQGISVTPLQLASAYAAIANGGEMMQPTIFKEVREKDGSLCKHWEPKMVRRVVSEATAEQVTRALVACVADGTGKPAAVEGYSVAGKTGSAQKVREDGKGYAGGAYVASFAGFVPASNPKLVILVIVDEPKGSHWGATCAAPVFREIARKSLWYMRTPRDCPTAAPNPQVVRRSTAA